MLFCPAFLWMHVSHWRDRAFFNFSNTCTYTRPHVCTPWTYHLSAIIYLLAIYFHLFNFTMPWFKFCTLTCFVNCYLSWQWRTREKKITIMTKTINAIWMLFAYNETFLWLFSSFFFVRSLSLLWSNYKHFLSIKQQHNNTNIKWFHHQ